VDHLRRASQLGPLQSITFDEIAGRPQAKPPSDRYRRAEQRARAYADEPRGWLVLTGPAGSGKTNLAAAIANASIERGQHTLFCVVPDLLDHLRATFLPTSDVAYDELFESVRAVPLLILDDLGAQSGTPWADEKLFQILNHRSNSGLPTVITTNVRLDDLDERMRARVTNPHLVEVCQVDEWARSGAAKFGLLPARLREMTFRSFDVRGATGEPEHVENLRGALRLAQQLSDQPNQWVVFIGVHGCGKTHLAAAIANQQAEQGLPFCFVTVPDLLDHLRSTFAPDSSVRYDQSFEDVRNAPLLILDDLGAQSSTPWAQEKLFQILNHRYNESLPTVITSNLILEEHEPRLASRMLDHRICTVFAITAPPFRLANPEPSSPTRAQRSRSSRSN
jgi:DNA replication protein DnaC